MVHHFFFLSNVEGIFSIISFKFRDPKLKMLGLYLYTLIISHKSCNMLGILNKLTLYKELPTFVTNNVFLDKKVKTQQQQQHKKANIKTLAGAGD